MAAARIVAQPKPYLVLISGLCVLIAASASIFTPNAYADLLGVALFAAIIVWMLILVTHLGFRQGWLRAASVRSQAMRKD